MATRPPMEKPQTEKRAGASSSTFWAMAVMESRPKKSSTRTSKSPSSARF